MNRFFTLLLAVSCLTAVGQLPDYVPADGLVAWYRLDSNALDEGLLGNHLQIQGATSSTDRFMNELGAIYFDGGATLQASSFTGIGENSSHTISFWETHSSIQNGCVISETGGFGTGNKLHYCFRGPEDGVCIDGGCMGLDFYSSQHFTSFTAELDIWNHWVLTYESGSQNSQIFLNGDLVSEQPMPTSWTGTFYDGICIGAFCQSTGDASYFIGSIDDFGIWDRPLSPLEIDGLYESTNVGGCTDMTACNYNSEALLDDGSCVSCEVLATACLEGTIWSAELGGCIVANPADINLDGCVQLNDLLDLLSAYGDCGAEETPWQCGDPLEYQGYDYETVQIGEQCWFAENLRAENYRNGDAIPSGFNETLWEFVVDDATSTYGTDIGQCSHSQPGFDPCADAETSLAVYGRLYNFGAAINSRGLCPNGWHVSTDTDWFELELLFGMDEGSLQQTGYRGDIAPQLRAASDLWFGYVPLESNNSSGLSFLPGGSRNYHGMYINAGDAGYCWAPSVSEEAYYRYMNFGNNGVDRDLNDHRAGMSIRCIKDTE